MLYNLDFNDMEETLEKIVDGFVTCKNSDIGGYLSSFQMIDGIYQCVNPKDDSRLKHIKKNKYKYECGKRQLDAIFNNFLKVFNNNKDFFLEMSLDIVEEFSTMSVVIEKNDLNTIFDDRLTEEIMTDFFKYNNDGSLELFEDMKNSGRIYKNDLDFFEYNEVEALSCFSIPFDDNFIVIRKKFNDISTLGAIAHEVGHIVDFNDLKNRVGTNGKLTYLYGGIYSEVMSLLYEKRLYDFLHKEKICINEVKECGIDYFNEHVENIKDVIALSLLSDKNILSKEYSYCSRSSVFNYFEIDDDIPGDYDDITSSYLSGYDNIIYGYGCYIANIINYYLENDKSKGKEMLDKLAIIKSYYFDVNDLDYLGVLGDDKPKIFVRELEKLTE